MFHFSLAQFYLFFKRKQENIHTTWSAASFHFFSAVFALNKKQMTIIVGAVHMPVAGVAALMANADDVFGDTLAHAVVKNKIFADKISVLS